MDNLRKLEPTPDSGRVFSIVITKLEEAELWLRNLAIKTSEE